MSDIVKNILTDASVRDTGTIKDKLVNKAEAAAPWFSSAAE
ncbi:MAG TPA: hypothetical protein VLF43_02360 [Candidatus Saccharimonadales bacterium]|nr:hypothetical protein [Candidatus Saccharimonadales bacterium]